MNLKTWGTVALAAVMVAACAKEPRSGTDSKAGAPAAAREGGAVSRLPSHPLAPAAAERPAEAA